MEFRGRSRRSGGDRRASQRHVDAFSVRLTSSDGARSSICELRNVSEGGVAVVAPRDLEASPSDTLLIEFPLGRSASRVQTRCTVRGRAEKDGEPTLHLEFNDRSSIFTQTVHACIHSWESRPQPDRRSPRRTG